MIDLAGLTDDCSGCYTIPGIVHCAMHRDHKLLVRCSKTSICQGRHQKKIEDRCCG